MAQAFVIPTRRWPCTPDSLLHTYVVLALLSPRTESVRCTPLRSPLSALAPVAPRVVRCDYPRPGGTESVRSVDVCHGPELVTYPSCVRRR